MVLGLGTVGILPPRPQPRKSSAGLLGRPSHRPANQPSRTDGTGAAPPCLPGGVGTPTALTEALPAAAAAIKEQEQLQHEEERERQLALQLVPPGEGSRKAAEELEPSAVTWRSQPLIEGQRETQQNHLGQQGQQQEQQVLQPADTHSHLSSVEPAGEQQMQQAQRELPSRNQGKRRQPENPTLGRSRRGRSRTPGSSEQGSGKRRWRSGSGTPTPSASAAADLLGVTLEVPGSVFYVKHPKYFLGQVLRPDPKRKVPSVDVRFCDDNSQYWFPIADVQSWVAAMKRRGSWARLNPCCIAKHAAGLERGAGVQDAQGVAADEVQAAAQVLQSLSTSVVSGSGGGSVSPSKRSQRARGGDGVDSPARGEPA